MTSDCFSATLPSEMRTQLVAEECRRRMGDEAFKKACCGKALPEGFEDMKTLTPSRRGAN